MLQAASKADAAAWYEALRGVSNTLSAGKVRFSIECVRLPSYALNKEHRAYVQVVPWHGTA